MWNDDSGKKEMGDSESLSFEFSLPEQLVNRIDFKNMRSKKEEDRHL